MTSAMDGSRHSVTSAANAGAATAWPSHVQITWRCRLSNQLRARAGDLPIAKWKGDLGSC